MADIGHSMKNILYLGDSHARIFKYLNTKTDKFTFSGRIVGGATAYGCINIHSQSNAMKLFVEIINKTNFNNIDYVIIMLGEVDCGFVIWYRAEKYNLSVDEQIHQSIKNLFTFIYDQLLTKIDANKIIVTGANLPTILDNADKNIIKGLRSVIKTNLRERTDITLKYNALLNDKCNQYGYNYIDITKYLLDTDTNIIKSQYIVKNDHHIHNHKIYQHWLEELNKYA